MARVKTRILTDTTIDGVDYKVNQVVVLDGEQAERLQEAGVLDTSPASVKYCVDELGAAPIEHKPRNEEPAAAAPAKSKGKK